MRTASHGLAPVHHCSLCGRRFREGADSACAACPMHRGDCGLIRCPHCGYEFPAGSRVVHWIRTILTPRRSS